MNRLILPHNKYTTDSNVQQQKGSCSLPQRGCQMDHCECSQCLSVLSRETYSENHKSTSETEILRTPAPVSESQTIEKCTCSFDSIVAIITIILPCLAENLIKGTSTLTRTWRWWPWRRALRTWHLQKPFHIDPIKTSLSKAYASKTKGWVETNISKSIWLQSKESEDKVLPLLVKSRVRTGIKRWKFTSDSSKFTTTINTIRSILKFYLKSREHTLLGSKGKIFADLRPTEDLLPKYKAAAQVSWYLMVAWGLLLYAFLYSFRSAHRT